MKKKFSFVLAIIMVVCTLSIALVACAPKDPDPFTSPVKVDAYNEIWNSWVKTNTFKADKTLGIDLSVDAKNAKDISKTNLTIKLQAGLDGISGSDNEALRLAIIDNNKNDDILDIAINKDGLYFDAMDMEKALIFPELSLMALGVGEADILSSVKSIYDGIFSLIGTDVTIDPVLADKKAKLYDVKYTFALDFSVITGMLSDVDSLLDGLGADIPAELVGIIKQVVPVLNEFLGDLNVNFTVNTTGNIQEKVKKPAKNAPKYSYKGGTLQSISLGVTKADTELSIDVNGLKLLNTIPTIEVPAEANLVEASLLKHKITGTIQLRDEQGKSRSDYTYVIQTDFTAKNILTTIKECITTGSVDPLIKKIINDEGKLFIEINHTCGETCKTAHLNNYKADGSVIAIAYSPEEFKNNRVYVSLDLQTIINDTLIYDVTHDGTVGNMGKGMIPKCYSQFSFDFMQYVELTQTRASVASSTASVAGISTVADEEEPAFSLEGMIKKIIDTLVAGDGLQIEIDDLRGALEMLYTGGTLDDGTYWTILNAVDSLFDGVDRIAIDAVYTNGEDFEESILDLYTRQKEGVPKKFVEDGTTTNHKIISGEVLDWNKDAAGNVAIYGEHKDNIEDLELNDIMYDENGIYKVYSYGQLTEGVADKKAKGKNNTVVIKFKDINGEEVVSQMNIIEFAGLDPNNFNPQEVSLVLAAGGGSNKSAGIGSSINNLIGSLAGLSSLVPALKMIETLNAPEVVLKTTVQIYEVESVVWDQTKVAGITNSQIFDENKVYANGDDLCDTEHLTIEFKNGTILETDVKANNTQLKESTMDSPYADYVSSNIVTAWKTFDMEFSALGYSKSVTVKMDDSLGIAYQNIYVPLDGTYKFDRTNIENAATGGKMTVTGGQFLSVTDKFVSDNGLTVVNDNWLVVLNRREIKFTKAGVYTIDFTSGTMAESHITVYVDSATAVNETASLGLEKVYNGKIGDYEFTKAEAEKAATTNISSGMIVTAGGTEEEPTLSFTFTNKAANNYSFNFVDKNGNTILVKFNVTVTSKTISNQALNTEISINLNEQFTDKVFVKENIVASVEKFNATYAGKITMTFNNDIENPILTIKALETNGSNGYTFRTNSKQGEYLDLIIKFKVNTVKKEGSVGDKIVVTADEIGVPFTKEFAEYAAKNHNASSNGAKIRVAVIEIEDKLAIEIEPLQPSDSDVKFTLTNRCEIAVKSNLVVNVEGTVGTQLVLAQGTGAGQINHSYFASAYTNPIKTFNNTYTGKATASNSSTTLKFDFTEAGEYKIVIKNMTINITVKAAEVVAPTEPSETPEA